MNHGEIVIIVLKVAVAAVSVLLAISLTVLARGNVRLHGRLQVVFFTLVMLAVLGLEILIRIVDPTLFDYFDAETRQIMRVHLSFAIPTTILLPIMLYTGLTGKRRLHLALAVVFALFWLGIMTTGLFLLPPRPWG